MSFIVENLTSLGAFGPEALQVFSYSHPTDQLTDIMADGYFELQKFILVTNSVIFVKASEETSLIYITQNLPVVKTTFFIDLSGPLDFKGTWNADTNTPTLTSGIGGQGDVYIVIVAGTTDLDGITDWEVNDWAVFNGTTWFRVENTPLITSVNATNLTVTLGELNTIQDIDSTATPTFDREFLTQSLSVNTTRTTISLDGTPRASAVFIGQVLPSPAELIISAYGPAQKGGIHFTNAQGTEASPTICTAGSLAMDNCGWGYDGATYKAGAAIRMQVDAAPSLGDVQMNLHFLTRGPSDSAPASRMMIKPAGNIGFGTASPDANAYLHVNSTTQGVLFSPMTELERDAIVTPPEGLEIFNLTSHKKNYYNGTMWVESDDLPVFTENAIPFGDADGTLTEDVANFSFDDTMDQLSIGAPNTSVSINGEARNGSLLTVSNGVPEKWGVISQAFGSTTNAVITLTRARGNQNSPSASNSGDIVGAICSAGYDGTDYGLSAEIKIEASANHANDDTPGKMLFSTTAIGASTPTLAMTIQDDQSIIVEKSVSVNTNDTTLDLNGSPLEVNYLVENEGATGIVDFCGIQHGLSETVGYFGAKSDGTTASPTIPADTSTMVQYAGLGWDGITYRPGALIQMQVDGTAAAADMPGKIRFSTTPSGSTTPNIRMTIKADGRIGIGTEVPDFELHVFDNTDETARICIENDSSVGNRNSGYIQRNNLLEMFTGTSGATAGTVCWKVYSNTSVEVRIAVFEQEKNTIITDGVVDAPDVSAQLEVSSATKGFLPPRNANPTANIPTPVEGLMAFNTTTKQWEGYNGTSWVILG